MLLFLLLLLRYFHSTVYKLVDKSYFEILKLIHIETQINYILKGSYRISRYVRLAISGGSLPGRLSVFRYLLLKEKNTISI